MAGIEAPENQGRDILEWMRGSNAAPLRDTVFAQIGDYHGFIGTSWPSGMPASGRHKSLTHAARTTVGAYIRDPDNGDEAYDLTVDPNELHNLLKDSDADLPVDIIHLRDEIDEFERECIVLRKRLGVVPGDRGFVEGWE